MYMSLYVQYQLDRWRGKAKKGYRQCMQDSQLEAMQQMTRDAMKVAADWRVQNVMLVRVCLLALWSSG